MFFCFGTGGVWVLLWGKGMMFQLYSVLTMRIKMHKVETLVETRHSNLRHVS